GDVVPEFKSIVLLPQSTAGWRFIPVAQARVSGDGWRAPDFDDRTWREGKAPIGYGEGEIKKSSGTIVAEEGQDFVFRRAFQMPSELLTQKGVLFRVGVASDDSAIVFLNGNLIDKDPEDDHEFTYWNREVELTAQQLKPGRNVLALRVKNKRGSSD